MPNLGATRIVILCALAGLPFQTPPTQPPAGPPPDRMPFERIEATATLEVDGVTGLGITEKAVWLVSRDSGVVSRVDPATNAVAATVIPGEWPCAGLVAAFGSLWVPLCGEYGMARVDLENTTLTRTMATMIGEGDQLIATGVGSIWMLTSAEGTLARIDPDTNMPVAEVYVAPGSRALAFGHDALWAASADRNVVTRVNPYSNVIVETITVGKGPRTIAVGEDAVWTLNAGDGTVSRIDPKTNKVAATITVGETSAAGFLAVGEGSVWISASGAPLTRIDPRSNRVVQEFTGEGGGLVAVGHSSLWLLAAPETLWRIDPKFVAALRPGLSRAR